MNTVEINKVIVCRDRLGLKSTYKEMKEETEAIQSKHSGAKETFFLGNVTVRISIGVVFTGLYLCQNIKLYT